MTRRLTLGVHVGHDAAAAVFADSRLVYAEEEERHSRVKSQGGCPWKAIEAALEAAGPGEVRAVALTWKLAPYLACRRALAEHARSVGNEPWFEKRQREIATVNEAVEALRQRFPAARVLDFPHHHAHLGCAVHFGPREPARGPVLGVVADALGDEESLAVYSAVDDAGLLGAPRVVLTRPPAQSIGFLYKRASEAFGFSGSEAPGHLMSLSGCATRDDSPLAWMREGLFTRDSAGFLQFRPDRFDPFKGHGETAARCFPEELLDALGLLRPCPRERLLDRAPQAHALQAVVEDYLEELLRRLVKAHRPGRIYLSGGVFLNCIALERLARTLAGVELVVCPVKKDSGTALGAAVLAEAATGEATALVGATSSLRLGTTVSGNEPEWTGSGHYRTFSSPTEQVSQLADDLQRGLIVALVDGRGEFGPRALGARSILADPSNEALSARLNAQVKCRYPFQPFAGAFLAEPFGEPRPAPEADAYMSYAARFGPDARGGLAGILHRDGTCRVQLVPGGAGSVLSRLLEELRGRGARPVVLNTSLNARGEPMPRTAADVLKTCAGLGLTRIYTPTGRWTA